MNTPDVDQALLALALATVSEGSLITDAARETIYANPAFTEITGYAQSEIIGKNCRFLQGPDTSPVELQVMRNALNNGEVFQGTLLNYRKNGTPFWNHLTITPLKDTAGQITNFVSVQRDVTEQVQERDALAHLAIHDHLTGLPNRAALRGHIRSALSEASEDGSTVAVAMIDLDDFKVINDRYGHLAGDAVLSEFAVRMRERLRHNDYLARVGGDEFVVVSELSPSNPIADFAEIADRLHEAVESPFRVDNAHFASIGMSMGVALFPRDGVTGRDLLRTADTALYRVKPKKGRRSNWWDAAGTDATSHTSEGESGGSRMPVGELVMFMQPIVDLRSGHVTQVEALARLRTPSGQIETPDNFLPHYSRDQLVDVFKQGLDQSLRWASRWDAEGLALNVSVNVPPELLSDPNSADWVRSALVHHSVVPSRLSLEVLETQELDLSTSDKTVSELVRLGVKMHLDDLSSGFSTLKRLTDIPFDVIKIDRRIFDQAHTRPLQVLTVLASITRLGAESNYGTVVEGIEDRERLEVSAILGARSGQGYLFARPMPPEEVGPWLEQFTMPYRADELTTALGALAYHWSHGRGDWHEDTTYEQCPLTGYLSLSEADAEVVAAHKTLHARPPAESEARIGANATLLARLVEQVQHTGPSDAPS
ncbi:EAL domain-containing protein [Salinibacterium sp. TMP30]|uniref:putative bifunctional diguanylate cyclase/phosphodiesterase n=1 Tax=Salinibacterium sp. TMP30 TaxID=3138237 RepID=UPI003139A20E